MLYPSIDALVRKVDSKYSLVVATAKRARYLQEVNLNQTGTSTTTNVTRALWEIFDGQITYSRTDEDL
jgi:DNA-directed RNA polymerase subunit omega